MSPWSDPNSSYFPYQGESEARDKYNPKHGRRASRAKTRSTRSLVFSRLLPGKGPLLKHHQCQCLVFSQCQCHFDFSMMKESTWDTGGEAGGRDGVWGQIHRVGQVWLFSSQSGLLMCFNVDVDEHAGRVIAE